MTFKRSILDIISQIPREENQPKLEMSSRMTKQICNHVSMRDAIRQSEYKS